ncbi:ECF transporter S component [Lentilactobacillus kosonis]|uniref:Substrate-specific component PanT of predicted pantothenate ECF transporter n=1 Tax=Lentilactobacillus kosonis TaxID=2810561 RepID=A0A401FLI2_9LACO|nr:ECF transporter S component [Lentilactobacillus kosonis]GAY73239.1 substrate-specific component PanT of predicted pantothenate ECF transporter [Lentilactobacillus kosonis]
MNQMNRTFRLSVLAMFIAIIILQTSIPIIGYIPVGPLEITIIQVTVVIATILMGTINGAVIGGVWGLITFVRAFAWPTSPLAAIVFVNPVVSVVPRILIAVVAGATYNYLSKRLKSKPASISIAAVLGSLTNTVLVLGMIYLFYKAKAPQLYNLNIKDLLPYLLGVVGTNGIPEAIFSGIVAPMIAVPLQKAFGKRLQK